MYSLTEAFSEGLVCQIKSRKAENSMYSRFVKFCANLPIHTGCLHGFQQPYLRFIKTCKIWQDFLAASPSAQK